MPEIQSHFRYSIDRQDLVILEDKARELVNASMKRKSARLHALKKLYIGISDQELVLKLANEGFYILLNARNDQPEVMSFGHVILKLDHQKIVTVNNERLLYGTAKIIYG